MYYVAVALLYRERTLGGPFSAATVMASSTIAGIVADFIARDEVRFLNPIFAFYLLVAAISLLSCHRYAGAWEVAQEDLQVVARALDEMKLKWPSARGSIDTFQKMYQLTVTMQRQVEFMPGSACMLTAEQASLLGAVDSSLCRMWDVLMCQDSEDQLGPASGGYDGVYEDSHSRPPGFHAVLDQNTSASAFPGMMIGDGFGLDGMVQQETAHLNGGIGEWLFWDDVAGGGG
jgi:hypothetical protein